MPIPSPSPLTTHEYQVHYGAPPGTPDPVVECKKWEKLCADLLAERKTLREDLEKAQIERDRYLKTVSHFMCKDYVCPYTDDEMLAQVGRQPPLRDFIAELEGETGIDE